MKLYFWAETHIIAKSIKRAKELLENDGLDQGRFPIEYQGDDDYIMQLYDINKEDFTIDFWINLPNRIRDWSLAAKINLMKHIVV